MKLDLHEGDMREFTTRRQLVTALAVMCSVTSPTAAQPPGEHAQAAPT